MSKPQSRPMFIFCTGLHLWKRLWSFSSHWQKLFTTNNSQNRLLDGQTGERGAQAWKSQVSGIVQPLRCEMMHFETKPSCDWNEKPENYLDTVSSRPVAASHHCLEVLAKNLEIQKKKKCTFWNPIEPAEPEILQRKRPQLRLCQRSPPLKDGKLLKLIFFWIWKNVKILWNGSHWEGVEFSVLNSNHLK